MAVKSLILVALALTVAVINSDLLVKTKKVAKLVTFFFVKYSK